MSTYYNGNLADLRKSKNKIISKIEELKKFFNHNLPLKEQIVINNKVSKLHVELKGIEKEMKKIQTGMKNSNKWMDGSYNNTHSL